MSDPQRTSSYMLHDGVLEKSSRYLFLVLAQVVHFLSPYPVVQVFVKKRTGTVDMNASEYLIKKWLIPRHFVGQMKVEKEASMIHLFHQEFDKIAFFLVVSLFC